jgi:hypothetical protein
VTAQGLQYARDQVGNLRTYLGTWLRPSDLSGGLAKQCQQRADEAYIPHIEDAIWHEFSEPLLRPKRLLWDAEQSKQLTLQVCELNVEDLHGLAVLDELVSLSEAE